MNMKLRSRLCRSISFCWRSLGPSTILTLEGFTVKTQYPFGAMDLAEQPNHGRLPIPRFPLKLAENLGNVRAWRASRVGLSRKRRRIVAMGALIARAKAVN